MSINDELGNCIVAELEPIFKAFQERENKRDVVIEQLQERIRVLEETETPPTYVDPVELQTITRTEIEQQKQDLINSVIANVMAKLPQPKDGKGIVNPFIDRDGNLILTYTDGTTSNAGKVVGDQGVPGKDGKDGIDGKDGRGLEDLEFDGVRTFTFKNDVTQKTFKMPWPYYREIWKDGTQYDLGDEVTWAGSAWRALRDTREKPGEGSKDWRLATKKGRDGRDGVAK